MTRKIMSLATGGVRIECIKEEGKVNPYVVRLVWWDDGWHRKKMNAYADFTSVLYYLLDYQHAHLDKASIEVKLNWIKNYK